jgi:Papain-like cysteine protease AvrRpt2
MPLASESPLAVYQTPQIDGNTVLLQIPWYPSAQEEWCWAACAQMLAYYFQNALTDQCTFAKLLFPGTDCCGAPAACDQPIDLSNVTALFPSFGKSATFLSAPIEFGDIQSEIAAGRPVQVGYQWSTQGNHVAVIAGVSEDNIGPLVYVNDPDPQFANGWVYYSNLKLAYGLGTWQWTWTSIQ